MSDVFFSGPHGALAKQAVTDREWRDWIFSPPALSGYSRVEAYRPDGLAGWDQPKVIEVGKDPWLNVAGLHWRPVSKG